MPAIIWRSTSSFCCIRYFLKTHYLFLECVCVCAYDFVDLRVWPCIAGACTVSHAHALLALPCLCIVSLQPLLLCLFALRMRTHTQARTHKHAQACTKSLKSNGDMATPSTSLNVMWPIVMWLKGTWTMRLYRNSTIFISHTLAKLLKRNSNSRVSDKFESHSKPDPKKFWSISCWVKPVVF